MNQAMGAKLVWRFISGKKEWWKEVLRKKYLKTARERSLEIEWKGKGMSIWNLCKNSIGLIKYNCYWIPGNEKKIKLLNEKVLGLTPRIRTSKVGEFMDNT